MKEEQDKELDILLRRNAKRASLRSKIAMAADEENGKKAFTSFEASEHLDADAMNAYAENALPNPTRIRYAEHLINCDACRILVTQLAITANPIEVEKKELTVVADDATKQTWGAWFLSLFTIPNLKVAGPIAAVLCIAAVTFIAFQRRAEMPKSVGGQRENDVSSVPSTKSPSYSNGEEKTSNTNASKTSGSPTPAGSPTENTPASDKTGGNTAGKEKPETRSKSDVGSADKPDDGVNKTAEENKDTRNEPSKKSPEPVTAKQAPKPTVTGQVSGPATNANQTQVNASQQEVAVQQPGPNRANRDRSATDVANERKPQPSPAAQTAGGSASTGEDTPKDVKTEERQDTQAKAPRKKSAKLDDDENLAREKSAPTRNVGGKEFYQKGSVWVDTAYNNSSTINIQRNSDEYKALDSGLRSIAGQFGGTVIIVWGGKAYRIY